MGYKILPSIHNLAENVDSIKFPQTYNGLLTRDHCNVKCSASVHIVTQGASFVSGCSRCEGVRENTLSFSFSLVKKREGILYLFPSFSFTLETAEHAGHEQSVLSNTMYTGRLFSRMLEVCYGCENSFKKSGINVKIEN